MNTRPLGKAGNEVSDVYGDGRSERIIAEVLGNRTTEGVVVATKAGRRLDPHVAEGYTIENIEAFIDRSRANLHTDTLDLVQLHCPPTEVYYDPELFDGLDALVSAGKIRHYGVSVEKVEEALKAIEYPGVATVQIIFNAFRLRPASLFFGLAAQRQVGVIARVPLASGLLTGKMSADSTFAADDHRNFNRQGEAFDVGETFRGVPYEVGLEAVDRLGPSRPGASDHGAVGTSVDPDASRGLGGDSGCEERRAGDIQCQGSRPAATSRG